MDNYQVCWPACMFLIIKQLLCQWHNNAFIIKWYHGYQKRKSQKAKIKEELLPIVWHPNRVMKWCMSENYYNRHRAIFLFVTVL